MGKLDKETKKEIGKVFQKYRIDYSSNKKSLAVVSGIFIGCGVTIDILSTGGIFSAASALFVPGGLAAAGLTKLVVDERSKKTKTNTAGQTIECAIDTESVLKIMERNLGIAFTGAARPDAKQQEYKDKFLRLADEIEQDVKTISPLFNVISGGDNYQFIVDKEKGITLGQAREIARQPIPPTLEQREIERLKEELEAIKTPKIAKLDKKYFSPEG
jgi:hypothetical protein